MTRNQRSGRAAPLITNIIGIAILLAVLAVCLPLTLPRLLNYEIYNVESGSMEPEVPMGSVVYVHEADPTAIETGDIIAFLRDDTRIVHRVVENRLVEGQFVTKGDANSIEDLEAVSYDAFLGLVEYHFPYLGQMLALLTGTIGKVYVIIFAACGVMFNILAARMRVNRRNRHRIADLAYQDYVDSAPANASAAVNKKRSTGRIIRRICMVVLAGIFLFSAGSVVLIMLQYRKNNEVYREAADKFVRVAAAGMVGGSEGGSGSGDTGIIGVDGQDTSSKDILDTGSEVGPYAQNEPFGADLSDGVSTQVDEREQTIFYSDPTDDPNYNPVVSYQDWVAYVLEALNDLDSVAEGPVESIRFGLHVMSDVSSQPGEFGADVEGPNPPMGDDYILDLDSLGLTDSTQTQPAGFSETQTANNGTQPAGFSETQTENEILPADVSEQFPNGLSSIMSRSATSILKNPDAYVVQRQGTRAVLIPRKYLPEYAPIEVDFGGLRDVNDDVIGWIYCDGTVINYPVLQAADNNTYLRHTYDGAYNIAGSVFVEGNNKRDFQDTNTIVYGHHMQDGSMFACLEKWGDQEFYDSHPVIWLLTPEQDYKIVLWAGYHTSAFSDTYLIFEDVDEDFPTYIQTARADSQFQANAQAADLVDAYLQAAAGYLAVDGTFAQLPNDLTDPQKNGTSARDKFVTSMYDYVLQNMPTRVHDTHFVVLSTCAYIFDNARYVLHGMLVPVDSAGGVPIR